MTDIFWQGLIRINARMLFLISLFVLALLAAAVAVRYFRTGLPEPGPESLPEAGAAPAYRLEGAWDEYERREAGNPFSSVFLDTFYARKQMREERVEAMPEPAPEAPPDAVREPEPAPQPEPPPPPSAVLVYRGLIENTDGLRLALIENAGKGEQQAYRLNDTVLPGRTLASMERTRAVLRDAASGTNRWELTVNEKQTVIYERSSP